MTTTVYLADLRHNYSGVLGTDCMPLSVAYMKAVMDRDLPEVVSRLFAYPDRLLDAMVEHPPDVLMVGNYIWNEALGLHAARVAKRLNPETLVVMGGPNISLERERQAAYFRSHPELDVYVLGEGDLLAAEVVKHFLDAGKSIHRLRTRQIPSCLQWGPDGETVHTPMWDRKKGIDEIPSPWLTGIQDAFFDGKLAPMIETNRGCPFTCTFCVQGVGWYTKVHYFSKERMFEEIEYIARRIKAVCPNMGTLRIADSNFGMFERDVEISGHLGLMQKKYGWPTFIDATTGKNRADRIIRSVEQVGGALVVYQAVQSLNEDVLRKIKRSTIKLEAYAQLQVHIRGRGLRSTSDLILALPGETIQTHREALHQLVDTGINSFHNFQCMLLKGSELETEESRHLFAFESRFRVLPKSFGVYGGERVLDVEEIVVATDTFSFDDYLTARKYHLAGSVFWNDEFFEDAVRFAQQFGLRRSECWQALVAAMERGPASVRQLVDDFVTETVNELFPTLEACVAFYSQDENFRRMEQGDVGDNLMYKYRAKASFFVWPDICRVAMDALRDLCGARGAEAEVPDFYGFWREFHRYVEARHAHGTRPEEILAPASVHLGYDIARWLADGSPKRVTPYRLEPGQRFELALSAESAQSLSAALTVWGTSLKGLTKAVTRIQLAWQIRECGRAAIEARPAPAG